jgi:hypothetical protein
MPPWPGKMVPESLRCKLLFIRDLIRSPNVPVTTIMKAMIIQVEELIVVKKYEVMYAVVKAETIPPMLPSHVFLGERRSNK